MAHLQGLKDMRDDFEHFLVGMDVLFEDLDDALASTPYAGPVAYDDASLARIEKFYLDFLAGKIRIQIGPQRMDRIVAAFYGEALRERRGAGTWVLAEDVHSEEYGTPVIHGWADGAMNFAPFVSCELQKSDRKPFIMGTIDYAVNLESIEASFFDEFD